ncbi:MAG: 30S ribosomal protein S17 [Planctomycetota bacterium]|nr:MAG: 30S ribosomal protein S17 [Planctomycetota bacterium]
MSAKRGRRKVLQGRVKSDKMQKTRVVEVERLVKHARYGKYIRRRTRLHVHDENEDAREGDIVEVMQTRPLSKTKHWRLVRVVRRAGEKVVPTPQQQEVPPSKLKDLKQWEETENSREG